MKARSHHAQWEYVGEGFVKEVDFSRVWLRLNESDDVDKDDIVAEWKGDAKAFLQSTLVCFPFLLFFCWKKIDFYFILTNFSTEWTSGV